MSDASHLAPATTGPALGNELAALLLVPAAAVGFIRVFEEPSASLPVIAAALLSSLVAVTLRRLRIPLPIAAVLSLLLLAITLVNALAPGTTDYGVVPTEETWTSFSAVADEALEQFRSKRAPVEALDGFLAAGAAGAWIAAFIVDWAALRLRLAFEPVLPAGLLFIFTSVTGSGDHRIASTAVFAGAIGLWAVAHRLSRERRDLWLTSDRRRGPSRQAAGTAALSATALAIGLVAGPLLPGAGERELFDWRNSGDPTRVVVTPFVNIGARLVNQRDVELFKVRTDRPAYYRLAGLETVEDGVWLARAQQSVEEDGRLPGRRPSAGATAVVRQDFEIQALSGEWLPAAYAPSEIIESDAPFSWIADTGSLIIDDSRSTVDGAVYSIASIVPVYTADELRSASTRVPDSIARRYLGLPEELTPAVATTAREVTAGAETRYDQLLALQSYFREFRYSVNLSPRTGDPTEQFLEERVGFCQQFSGTFALMARTLGIPSRVAVGFTWGQPLAGEPNTYQITGRHTHAWPEVYFDDLGWVAFEPTPQRGAPSAESYTGIPADQDDPVQPDNPFATTTTTLAPSTDGAAPGTLLPEFDEPVGEGAGSAGSGGTSGGLDRRVLIVVAAVAAAVLGLPLIQRVRRDRRRRHAVTPAERVDSSWADVVEALERQRGILRAPSETRASFCGRLATQRDFASYPFEQLGAIATTARFAPRLVTDAEAASAEAAADRILAGLAQEQSLFRRWWADADPRRLLRPTSRVRTPAGRPPVDPPAVEGNGSARVADWEKVRETKDFTGTGSER